MAVVNYIGIGSDSIGLVETGVSAAGTTQGTATRLRAQNSDVGTVASGAGVVLTELIAPGEEQSVFNSGANSLKVYPASGMQINALSTNAAMVLATNTGVIFKCVSTTRMIGVLSA